MSQDLKFGKYYLQIESQQQKIECDSAMGTGDVRVNVPLFHVKKNDL